MPTRNRLLITSAVAVATLAAAIVATTAVHAAVREGHPDAEEHEAVTANPRSTTGSCGVERWAVKTGTDTDRAKITLQSTTATSIAALTALAAPARLPRSPPHSPPGPPGTPPTARPSPPESTPRSRSPHH